MQENLGLREVERRIEEARRTQAESLDLTFLTLSKLPASLGDLPYLRELTFGAFGIDFPEFLDLSPLAKLQGLQSLDLTWAKVKDLRPLASLQGLQSLGLSFSTVSDLSPLTGLQGLQSLDLSFSTVSDLSPLTGLQGLQRLDLQKCTDVSDLSPLAGLQGLQHLDLKECTGVSDLSPLAGLQGLQHLDLKECTGVSDLSPLAGLQGLQYLDLKECTGVSDLSPLAGLQGLQHLDLRECTGVSDLSPLAVFLCHGLPSLDLSGCTGVTDLSPLADLQGLHSLALNRTGVSDLSPLADLRGLHSLYLWGTEVSDLSPLSGLQGLQLLELQHCIGVSDLSPLSGLKELQSLDLQGCTSLSDLSPLFGLKGLHSLCLWGMEVSDLSPLSGLQGLQSLNLHSCIGVSDLSPLSGLKGLQSLKLNSCIGVSDLSPLSGLQGLQSLNLRSCIGVSDLSPLSGLKGLQSLNLYECISVSDLSPLAGLEGLRNLDLHACTSVTALSPLAGLKGLYHLDIYGCGPAVPTVLLQAFAGFPNLTSLVVEKAVGVPREILSKDINDSCLDRLRPYVAEIALGAEAENEVKVILLGNGCVGKTQLCRRFRGQPFDKSVESTHGVQIWREELRIRAGGQEQVFQVNWWDFGGQDIYHGTHALFLRSRAVFLILWTPDLEKRTEYLENEIPLRNQPLAYWLDYVRTLAGEGSPVIVVQSQCDHFADRRPDPARPDGFGFFECCAYSAREDLGRETLEGRLRDAFRYLLERNGALEIGHGRAEVRRRLYGWRSENQKREPENRQHRTLTLEAFRALCNEVGGIVSWEHALAYFHYTGVVFYRPDLFSSGIVLDQDWALDAVYAVFHRGRTVPWLRDSGCFTSEDLAATVWQGHSVEEQRFFLGLMKSCGVCFACGKTSQGEVRYVAPDLLPGFEIIAGRLHAWKEEPGTPTLWLGYRFFHPAVIRSLMSEIGSKARDLAEYWKYGLWLKDGQRDAQLLVRFEDTSTDAAPGAGVLTLRAQGRDPLGLLREIRKALRQRRIGSEPKELLTLEGTTVAWSALETVIDGRVLDIHKKLVPAAAFAAFFEDREHHPGEAPVTGEASRIDINPRPLSASEKPREVFISYAWGDETPEGKIREQTVEALYTALAEDGFLPIRDRDQMRAGDRISAFMSRLTHADLVVAVISDKYLHSSYCMYEIYRLWQKCQGYAGDLGNILVPIVLPEVKVGDLVERVPYMKYWTGRANLLDALFRDPSINPGNESFKEVRLVREFAHHVDDILFFLQDVLMPRKLKVHLDDGFQAVRDALRRRMRVGE